MEVNNHIDPTNCVSYNYEAIMIVVCPISSFHVQEYVALAFKSPFTTISLAI